MSGIFVADALFTGAKEALAAGLTGFAVFHFMPEGARRPFLRIFSACLLIALAASPLVLIIPDRAGTGHLLSKLIGYQFLLLYMGAVLAVYHYSGVRLFPTGLSKMAPLWLAAPLMGILCLLFLAPDFAGSFLHLYNRALVLENPSGMALSTITGFLVVTLMFYILRRPIGSVSVSGFFGLPQLLLFLALVKLLFGGTRGLVEFSLVPFFQARVMKFVHDLVHHTFNILLVPDHPLLKLTIWNFIGFFFGPNFGLLVSLLLLLTPPIIFIKRLLGSPFPETGLSWTGAERRLFFSGILVERRKKAAVVACFIAVILAAWFVKGGEESINIYVPAAKPLVEDKGVVVIPLKDPTMDLRDGAIHKFALSTEKGERIGILVVSRSDGSLAVCLDACEICPPEGYGQQANTVICLYCATPITTDTLGKPGGCNPIPIKANISDVDIRIPMAEILLKWSDVKTGRTRENLP